MITSAQIQWTEDDPSTKLWMVKFQTSAGQRTAISKHVVMATGIGSQKMNIPSIADSHLYKGNSINSEQYKNTEKLKEKGAEVGEAPAKINWRNRD
ncbi:hypothetical protein N7527_006000 [Penicillium freii]|nr:hypothetical protein N7527_006000 [Penicillium freii]